MATTDERKLELERRKQRLVALREEKRRREDERRRMLLNNAAVENGAVDKSLKTLSQKYLDELLEPLGIPSLPLADSADKAPGGDSHCTLDGVISNQRYPSVPRIIRNLQLCETQITSVIPKDAASYCKTTQTDDERVYTSEFSLGSQEFDYDEEMPMLDKHLDINFDESPSREIANILPNFSFSSRQQPEVEIFNTFEEKTDEEAKFPDLSEEEKLQILSSSKFYQFFDYSSRVMEREIAEEIDIFVDYSRDEATEEKPDSGEKLMFARKFVDEKWSAGR
ncbi:unnamed protein product [Gongylonema pulchrum]|uniref:INCENP_ARK-bind domain-containing protein n=1 Tax=Gongylonema pulchrum TaxID=637853 RepID=A0A183ENG2_9BILA|nr:unnamed protein product [Gongylonema pulchrum]